MPTINILYDPITDKVYVFPELAILTPTDQSITWNLTGTQWGSLGNAIQIATIPTGPYQPWPGSQPSMMDPSNPDHSSYFVNLAQPNQGPRIYYTWTYNIIDVSGKPRIDDPDIGNDPPSGP